MSIRYKSGFVLFRSLECGLFLCIIGLQKCAKSVNYVKFFIYLRTKTDMIIEVVSNTRIFL